MPGRKQMTKPSFYVGQIVNGREIVGVKYYSHSSSWLIKCQGCLTKIPRSPTQIREGNKPYCRACAERYRIKTNGGRKKLEIDFIPETPRGERQCALCDRPSVEETAGYQNGITYPPLCRECYIRI